MRYTLSMLEKKLRVVKQIEGVPVVGACERCNKQFAADPHVIGQLAMAKRGIQEQFEVHDCKPIDSIQNALWTVRRATESACLQSSGDSSRSS
jgi:hypothetical protein